MEFGSICLILEIIRVKLESENVIRVKKMTQLTRVTQLELPTLLKKQSYRAQVATPLQKGTQVWFEFPAEIPIAHELLMKMLQENAKIKKNLLRDPTFSIYVH